MNVFLSHLAEKKIQLLLEYLKQEWSEQTQKKYLFLLIRKFELISRHPQSATRSKDFPNLYKCIVDKHSSFYYRIINKNIEIITLIDNRQNPEKVAEEIKSFFRKE